MKKDKHTCDKCKKDSIDLYLLYMGNSIKTLDTNKEIWICSDCSKKYIKDFEAIECQFKQAEDALNNIKNKNSDVA